jgi:hypothetical protein
MLARRVGAEVVVRGHSLNATVSVQVNGLVFRERFVEKKRARL